MDSSRVGVRAVFFLHGAGVGVWFARIPAIQEALGLSVGELGLVLLGAGVGTLAAMVPAGVLIARFGSREVVRWSLWPAALTIALLGLAPTGPALFVALVAWAASTTMLDITMNAQGSTIEQRLGRPLMSSLHGFWSLGNLAGAATGALLASVGVGALPHLVGAAPVLLVALLLAARHLVPGDADPGSTPFAWPGRPLLALAALAFCAVTVEGAMFDWGGVHLRQTLGAPEALAAGAAGAFSAAMAFGRLTGDYLSARFHAPTLARTAALLAALGLSAVVWAPVPAVVLLGLVGVGLGLSTLVPLAFSAAGRNPSMPAGSAIAAVATMGYLGLLLGPPTLGLVAEQITLRGALALLLVLLGGVALLAPALGAASTKGPAGS